MTTITDIERKLSFPPSMRVRTTATMLDDKVIADLLADWRMMRDILDRQTKTVVYTTTDGTGLTGDEVVRGLRCKP